MVPSPEDDLRKALKEYDQVKKIIENGIGNYKNVQQLMPTNRIYIPISHRGIVKRLFLVQAAAVIETPDETHEWLVSHYNVEAHNIQAFERPNFDIENYDELFQCLINSKDELNATKTKCQHKLNLDTFWSYFVNCMRTNTFAGINIPD